jgi:hypothetical protein
MELLSKDRITCCFQVLKEISIQLLTNTKLLHICFIDQIKECRFYKTNLEKPLNKEAIINNNNKLGKGGYLIFRISICYFKCPVFNKNYVIYRGIGVAQAVECLSSKWEALSSNFSTSKKKKTEKGKKL